MTNLRDAYEAPTEHDTPNEQICRDCGDAFPYDPDADRCPACIAEMIESDDDEA